MRARWIALRSLAPPPWQPVGSPSHNRPAARARGSPQDEGTGPSVRQAASNWRSRGDRDWQRRLRSTPRSVPEGARRGDEKADPPHQLLCGKSGGLNVVWLTVPYTSAGARAVAEAFAGVLALEREPVDPRP